MEWQEALPRPPRFRVSRPDSDALRTRNAKRDYFAFRLFRVPKPGANVLHWESFDFGVRPKTRNPFRVSPGNGVRTRPESERETRNAIISRSEAVA